ncbi:hypothetical protein PF005_g13395 [Phytophthora fragariae]|uniref:Uncharacterized protein n=2 Tax=Phytophthora fragariae TaxID=53985 RepID=A0A6A3XXQ1_9STRA|nr:hypothetical protein PF003_g31285 [Phytophthora fragariae]KAE9205425.1 hypothetical protein PF005_g13395 [Phytophthora fragariae]
MEDAIETGSVERGGLLTSDMDSVGDVGDGLQGVGDDAGGGNLRELGDVQAARKRAVRNKRVIWGGDVIAVLANAAFTAFSKGA